MPKALGAAARRRGSTASRSRRTSSARRCATRSTSRHQPRSCRRRSGATATPRGCAQRAAEEMMRTAQGRPGASSTPRPTRCKGAAREERRYGWSTASPAAASGTCSTPSRRSRPTQIEAGFADFATPLEADPGRRSNRARTCAFALEVHPTEIAFDVATTRRALAAVDGPPALRLQLRPLAPGLPGRRLPRPSCASSATASSTCTSRTSGGADVPTPKSASSAATPNFGDDGRSGTSARRAAGAWTSRASIRVLNHAGYAGAADRRVGGSDDGPRGGRQPRRRPSCAGSTSRAPRWPLTPPSPNSMTGSKLAALGAGLGARLSVMMFLQYAIWGAWLPFLWSFLSGPPRDGRSPRSATCSPSGAVGAILGPFVAGQVADRYFATERILGIEPPGGGGARSGSARRGSTAIVMFLDASRGSTGWSTRRRSSLTNSLAFHHMPDPDRDFGKRAHVGHLRLDHGGAHASGHWHGAGPAHPRSRRGRSPPCWRPRMAGQARTPSSLSAVLGLMMAALQLQPAAHPSGSKGTSEANATFEALELGGATSPLLTLVPDLAVPVSMHPPVLLRAHRALSWARGSVGPRRRTASSTWINRLFGAGGGGLMTIGQMTVEVVVLALDPVRWPSSSRARPCWRPAWWPTPLRMFAVRLRRQPRWLPVMPTLLTGVALHGLLLRLLHLRRLHGRGRGDDVRRQGERPEPLQPGRRRNRDHRGELVRHQRGRGVGDRARRRGLHAPLLGADVDRRRVHGRDAPLLSVAELEPEARA